MASKTVIEESNNVKASQLKEFFRQVDEKIITGSILQSFIENRNPFPKNDKHIINLNADPQIEPSNLKVSEHNGYGFKNFVWDPSKVKLYIEREQWRDEGFKGTELHKKLKSSGMKLFNTNLLYYLLKHPHLIPEEWKFSEDGKPNQIYFWGTVYQLSDGRIYVYCLTYENGIWVKSFKDGQFAWYSSNPAAVLL